MTDRGMVLPRVCLKKINHLKYLLGIMFLSLLISSCQPSSDANPALPTTPSSRLPVTTTTAPNGQQRRYDQSLVLPVENHIQRPTGINPMLRVIPGVNNASISYCETVNGDAGKYSGIRDLKKYPLASVSKAFLSAWALDTLGPDYRFENLWYLKKVAGSDGQYDAYFRANYDPALNIEKMLYAMSLMNAQGVKSIRQLVIDETSRVYLSVLLDPHVELTEVPVSINKSIENLKIILNSANWGAQTATAKNNLSQFSLQKNKSIALPQNFSVGQVSYVESKNINIQNYTSVVKMKSSILLKYLKDINVNSNNYMADMFFNILGGSTAFKKFQQKRLNLSLDEIELYTGSGLPVLNPLIERKDNLGTCMSVLKTFKFIKGLSQQLNFNLGHVFLTAGLDSGTYDPTTSINFHQSMVVKTGRLYDVPALNVAGATALQGGTLFFAFLVHDFNNSDESLFKSKRDEVLQSIINFYPTTSSYQTLNLDPILMDLN